MGTGETRIADAVSPHDVACALVTVPVVGSLFLVATTHGLLQVVFGPQQHGSVLNGLPGRPGRCVATGRYRPTEVLEQAIDELRAYVAGQVREFDTPLDMQTSRSFRHQVHLHLRTLPYGHTRTYGAIAAALGNPKAVRAVGSACATNPLAILIPCHRVIRADGSPGRYAGGLHIKRDLLALEQANR